MTTKRFFEVQLPRRRPQWKGTRAVRFSAKSPNKQPLGEEDGSAKFGAMRNKNQIPSDRGAYCDAFRLWPDARQPKVGDGNHSRSRFFVLGALAVSGTRDTPRKRLCLADCQLGSELY